MKKTMRINKTKGNLEIVWEQLDDASGSLYNALETLYRMTNLGNEESDERNLISTLESIDISAIDNAKQEIEELIRKKNI